MLPKLGDITKKRKKLGLTQKKLANLAGASQSLIAKLESGKMNPSYIKVKALFDTLESLEIKTEANAKTVLHDRIVNVQKDDQVSKAVRLMREHGYSQLPVFAGKNSVGSISEKTILNQVLAGKNLSNVSKHSVGEIMDEGFPQVGEKTPLYLISDLLQVYPAVLISKRGKVLGIVTKADLLKMFS